MNHITPSLLCANQVNLQADIEILNELAVDWYHIDVMDGNFVPNFAIGVDAVRGIKKIAKYPLYIHFMGLNPDKYVDTFANLGCDYFSFHLETTNNPFRLCSQIRAAGMKPAISLNPFTEVSNLDWLLDYVDAITLMSVEPGFSGQAFLPFMLRKISELKKLIGDRNVLIEVDGGVDNKLAVDCLNAGCDMVVGGYFNVFKTPDNVRENYLEFRREVLGE